MRQEGERAAIRALKAVDLGMVREILEEAPEAANWSRQGLEAAMGSAGAVTFVSDAEGEISGFLVARQVGDEGEILNMAVALARQRRGDGGALLKAALDEFVTRGVSRVFLEVRGSNAAGIAFYIKHGFAKTGLRPAYYLDPAEAAILMEKKLGD